MCCNLFKKRDERIAHRRDVKRQASNFIVEIARQFPRAAHMGNNVDDWGIAVALIPMSEWWHSLGEVDHTILRTAKGCDRKPSGAPPHGYNNEVTFDAFLSNSLQDPVEQVYCFGAWLRVALLWAHQIRVGNPNTFPMATTVNIATEIEGRSEALRLDAIA
ncbi:MAG: hypothetical protein M3N82_03920 [Pseudomonadota bacterium]|nr:hypothetical protein [Pseudomonadota bacterium]